LLRVPEVEVELFGVPRLLVGRRSLRVSGRTTGEVMRALGAVAPSLVGPVLHPDTEWLIDGYTLVIDEVFSRDPFRSVQDASSVLLVSSVAGG
jgi:molybdopterin converting factor small subunit